MVVVFHSRHFTSVCFDHSLTFDSISVIFCVPPVHSAVVSHFADWAMSRRTLRHSVAATDPREAALIRFTNKLVLGRLINAYLENNVRSQLTAK